ncbi:MAG: tetratricopeptide repeat protein [Mucilaginibacter sp.]
MKYIITIFIAFFSVASFAQQITYAQWKKDAETEINLIPEYGNLPKPKEMIAEDQKLIDLAIKTDGTSHKASEHLVSLGFDYLYRGDLKTAMKRFNQAWLLDNKNENAYWGFGAIYFSFNDYDEALKQFEKGLLINPNSSNILTDEATINTGYFVSKHDANYLDKAIELFNKSYKIDPLNQNTLFKLSVAYFYKSDCANAWKYYDECMKLGGKSISPGYAEALKKQCNR